MEEENSTKEPVLDQASVCIDDPGTTSDITNNVKLDIKSVKINKSIGKGDRSVGELFISILNSFVSFAIPVKE